MSNCSFLDLSFDVVQLVLQYLQVLRNDSEGMASDVIIVSLLSKQLRGFCLPFMFWNVSWPRKSHEVEFFPEALWPHIKRLVYFRHGEHTYGPLLSASQRYSNRALDTLTRILPKLPNLVTFVYGPQRISPSPTFITTLAENSTSLIHLELSSSFLTHKAGPPSLFTTFSRIRHLVITPPEQSTLYNAPEEIQSLSLERVSNIIIACRLSLEEMDVPGEYCPLSTLTSQAESSTAGFPALKKLVLRGYPPLNAKQFPIWKVLSSMPRLSTLEISCKLRVIGASPQRYMLMPADAMPPLGSTYLFPSELESMTISNPSLTDNIFKRLPHSLRSLVLDFIPDWENILSSGDMLAYHRPSEIAKTFCAVEYGLKNSPFVNMQRLCIKMGWCITPDLLGLICRLFPHLQVLIFEGIRYVNRGEEPESDMEALVETLGQLAYLDTLKLAVELSEDPYRADEVKRKIGSLDESMQKWSNRLARKIPTLQRVAFETRPHTGRGLGPRALVGKPVWVWFVLDHKVEASADEDSGSNLMKRIKELY
ncbi:hypothetical protein VKT23_014807 [Stygiomarasmius scandens]|uniref:F-box domain-containing protein n=1 Tax=Marasmiellus scandens TaxID=2682957 RepID=A0ABR1J2J4_9AGAR